MSDILDPEKIVSEDWTSILLKASLLTSAFSDTQLLVLAKAIRQQLSPPNESPLQINDINEKTLSELKSELKGIFHFSNDYPRLRAAFVKSKFSALLEKSFGIHLPDSIQQNTQLPSAMVDTGESATFTDLKKGLQKNGLFNPFAQYIGHTLKSLPWMTIGNALRRQGASSPLLESLDQAILENLVVYHCTKDPKSLENIEAGKAYFSVGQSSIFGGAASWDEGVYLSFSDKLFWHGPFKVAFKLNENAIIGKDIDLFLGAKDGLIVVIKSDKGLAATKVKTEKYMPLSDQEPTKNHLNWFAKMAPKMSFDEKFNYVQGTIVKSQKDPKWGPFELLTLVHLDNDIFSNEEIKSALREQFNEILKSSKKLRHS